MTDISTSEYQGYTIDVTEVAGRFTPRVSRAGQMIEHDGKSSEIWAAASCGSMDRALEVAHTAIDSGRIK